MKKAPDPGSEQRQADRVRSDQYAEKWPTRIWKETPSGHNPYVTETAHCHGYDMADLLRERSYSDVLFLLFKGELPNAAQSELLERLQIACINPGPRHPATRAGMQAGLGKSDTAHILPVSLAIMAGERMGSLEVEKSVRFIFRSKRHDAKEFAKAKLADSDEDLEKLRLITPGFGSVYGGRDEFSQSQLVALTELAAADACCQWALEFSAALKPYGLGILPSGFFAAVIADLGFDARYAKVLHQLFSAPGLLAHGMEYARLPLTSAPFVSDDNYFIASDE